MSEINLFGDVEPHMNGVTASEIEELFYYWIEVFEKNANTILDEARSKKISIAIKNYGMETCKQAIKGCSLSSWHKGHNPNNKKYHDLTLIFRNAEKVEQFLETYNEETKAKQEMEEWLQK